ncbi:MAG TPA: type II toxin-antitoxin system Phd/YefM family antitoxin [Acidobacteriaceae bacterium]
MWQVQEAKAKFSEFLDKALREGPQVVSRRGVATAVLVRIEEWERLQKRARPSLKDLLLADEPRFEIDLPPRGGWKSRPIICFEDE